MATIRVSVDRISAFSIFEIEGTVSADDIVAAMERQYVTGAPPHALWDYSRATFHELNADDYARIAGTAKALAPNRPGGRTAFVAPGELEAVAIKFLEASSKMVELPIPLHICATREEAVAWLTSPD
jgi:hypothetical protein